MVLLVCYVCHQVKVVILGQDPYHDDGQVIIIRSFFGITEISVCVRLYPHLRGFWDNVHLFFSCLHFCFFSFFKVEISSHMLIPLFMPESIDSGSVS